jgi:hypothetical protein
MPVPSKPSAGSIARDLNACAARHRTSLSAAVAASDFALANGLRARISRLGDMRLELRDAQVLARTDQVEADDLLAQLAEELVELAKGL